MFPQNVTADCNLGKSFGVYQIRNLATGVIYVGSTTYNFRRRFNQHKLLLRKNKHDNAYLQNSWNTWGPLCFVFEVVEVLSHKEEVVSREQERVDELIALGAVLYNCSTIIANPMQGKHHSQETKEKIRTKAVGRKIGHTWNKGVKATDEHRKHVSEGVKRKFDSPAMREKISRAQTGVKRHTDAEKLKRSIAFKGDNNPAKRPEVRAKLSASQKARHHEDELSSTANRVLGLLFHADIWMQHKEIAESGFIPYGSLPRALRKLLRLGYVERDRLRRYHAYRITELGKQRFQGVKN